MTEEQQKYGDSYGEKFRKLEEQNVSLSKHILDLQKDKGELTDENKVLKQNLEDSEIVNKSLTDRVANLEYQLEGRDNEIKELKAQLEKMKCGGNCKFEYWKNTGGCYDQKCRFTGLDCTNCKDEWKGKWEMTKEEQQFNQWFDEYAERSKRYLKK